MTDIKRHVFTNKYITNEYLVRDKDLPILEIGYSY